MSRTLTYCPSPKRTWNPTIQPPFAITPPLIIHIEFSMRRQMAMESSWFQGNHYEHVPSGWWENSHHSRYWRSRWPLEQAASTSSLSISHHGQRNSSTSSKVFSMRSYPCWEARTSKETSIAGDHCFARWITASHRSWMTTTCSSNINVPTHIDEGILDLIITFHLYLHHHFVKTRPCVSNSWNEKFGGHGRECLPFKAPAVGGLYSTMLKHEWLCRSILRLRRQCPWWTGSNQVDDKVVRYAVK